MTATNWVALDLADSGVKKALDALKDSIVPVIDASLAIVKIVKVVADLVVNLLALLADPLVTALIAALEAVKKVIIEAFQDTGIYFLPIPTVSLPGFSPASDWYTLMRENASNILQTPPQDLENLMANATKAVEAAQESHDATTPNQSAFQELSQTAIGKLLTSKGNGGNAGFYRTVADSMSDPQDPNRPSFGQDAYIAAWVIMAGAEVYGDLIELLYRLGQLFQPGGQSGMSDPNIPRPKNLSVSLVGGVSDDPNGAPKSLYAVRLKWDLEPVAWTRAAFGGVGGDIQKVIIYRQNTPIKPGTPVSQLIKIDEIPYHGIQPWYDDYGKASYGSDGVLDLFQPNATLYYAVGYTFNMISNGEIVYTASEPRALAKGVMQFGNRISTGTGHGVPPDWVAINMLDAIPILKDVVNLVVHWIDDIEAGIKSSAQQLKDFLDFLQKIIDYYDKWLTNLILQIKAIIELFELPNIYIGSLAMAGQGGNDFFLSTLAEKLTDETDDNRPEFDKGTELTCGAVMLAGSNIPGALDAFKNLVGLFTSIENAGKKAVKDAVSSIGVLSSEVERQICFNGSMLQTLCGGADDVSSLIVPELALGDDMEPTENGDALCK
jgi:hypothetical protein